MNRRLLAIISVSILLAGAGVFMLLRNKQDVKDTDPQNVLSYSDEKDCEEALGEACILSSCSYNADETTEAEACGSDFVLGWISASTEMAKRSLVYAKVGDIFGDMQVVSVEPKFERGSFPSPATASNALIKLTGKTFVTGTYNWVSSSIGFDGPCMSKLENSPIPINLITGSTIDKSGDYSGFCLSADNQGIPKEKLSAYEGKRITVEIDEYLYTHCECEAVSWARFVRVVE